MTDMVPIMRDGEVVQVPADSVITPPAPPQVPQAVTRAQAKIALARANLFEAAVEAIAAAPLEAQIWWSEADTFRRDNEWVAAIGAVLGLDTAEIDALFIAAAQIVA